MSSGLIGSRPVATVNPNETGTGGREPLSPGRPLRSVDFGGRLGHACVPRGVGGPNRRAVRPGHTRRVVPEMKTWKSLETSRTGLLAFERLRSKDGLRVGKGIEVMHVRRHLSRAIVAGVAAATAGLAGRVGSPRTRGRGAGLVQPRRPADPLRALLRVSWARSRQPEGRAPARPEDGRHRDARERGGRRRPRRPRRERALLAIDRGGRGRTHAAAEARASGSTRRRSRSSAAGSQQGAVWQEHWSMIPPRRPPVPDGRGPRLGRGTRSTASSWRGWRPGGSPRRPRRTASR